MVRKIPFTLAIASLLTFGVITALFASNSPQAKEQTVQGVLIDKDCSYKAETRVVPGNRLEGGIVEAYQHDKACLLNPSCQRSGYGVYTYDGRFLMFDPAGKQKALELLKETEKESDFRVEVTGSIEGTAIAVASLKLL